MPLVLIDMQPEFRAARFPRVIRNCIRLVEQAISQRMPIVLCEYASLVRDGKVRKCKPTDQRITDLVKNYDRVHVIRKVNDDAGPYIVQLLRTKKIKANQILVGGVNQGACVADTVATLAMLLPKSTVKVVKSACGHWTGRCSWKNFPVADNIQLQDF